MELDVAHLVFDQLGAAPDLARVQVLARIAAICGIFELAVNQYLAKEELGRVAVKLSS